MHVLVIGGTQFIGRATVSALLSHGHNVTVLNRGRTPNPFGSCVRVAQCNRREQPEVLLAVLRETGGWDAVIDFLAFEPSDVAPIIEAGACCMRRYILISTDSIYMAVSPEHYVKSPAGALLESSDANGRADPARARDDEYGADKLSTEVALRAAAEKSDSSGSNNRAMPPMVALRLPDVVGPYENTGRLEKLLLKLLKGRRVGALINDHQPAAGNSLISVVAAADVASAVCAALEQSLTSRLWCGHSASSDLASSGDTSSGGKLSALHVCADEKVSWPELVCLFDAALRQHESLDVPALRLDASRDSGFVSVDCGALDNGLAKACLDWAPAPLEQRVLESVDWWLAEMRAGFERISSHTQPHPLVEVEVETAPQQPPQAEEMRQEEASNKRKVPPEPEAN